MKIILKVFKLSFFSPEFCLNMLFLGFFSIFFFTFPRLVPAPIGCFSSPPGYWPEPDFEKRWFFLFSLFLYNQISRIVKFPEKYLVLFWNFLKKKNAKLKKAKKKNANFSLFLIFLLFLFWCPACGWAVDSVNSDWSVRFSHSVNLFSRNFLDTDLTDQSVRSIQTDQSVLEYFWLMSHSVSPDQCRLLRTEWAFQSFSQSAQSRLFSDWIDWSVIQSIRSVAAVQWLNWLISQFRESVQSMNLSTEMTDQSIRRSHSVAEFGYWIDWSVHSVGMFSHWIWGLNWLFSVAFSHWSVLDLGLGLLPDPYPIFWKKANKMAFLFWKTRQIKEFFLKGKRLLSGWPTTPLYKWLPWARIWSRFLDKF